MDLIANFLAQYGIKLLAIALIIAVIGGGIAWYIHVERANKAYQDEITTLNQQLTDKQAQVDQMVLANHKQDESCKATLDAMNKKLGEQQARTKKLGDLDNAVKQAPSSDDGPVAPVLGDVLRQLHDNTN